MPSYGRTGGAYAVEGADAGKFAGDHMSPKYQILRTVSNFDFTKGITPEVLEALNSLGIGTFTSNGRDKVFVTGAKHPEFEGDTEIDLIRAFGDGGKAWQYGVGPMGGAPAVPTLPVLGGGLPTSGMTTPMPPGITAPTDDSTFAALQRRLQEILGNPDRDALMAQMRR